MRLSMFFHARPMRQTHKHGMALSRYLYRSFCVGLGLMSAIMHAQAQMTQEADSAVVTPAPWMLRYVLKIDTPYFFDIRATRGRKKLSNPKPGQIQEIEAIAGRVKTYVVENRALEREQVFSTLLLEFDHSGTVISRLDWPYRLEGEVDQEGAMLLDDASAKAMKFGIGQWDEGGRSEARPYAPVLCSPEDEQRYWPGFKPSSVSGNFGCREWGYYLKNPKMPYIDVTTYQLETDRTTKSARRARSVVSAMIKPVIGWGRFDIPPKPVIGRHGDSWFCLHDCPDGDLPGYIPNIKSWLARHHWPMPVVPKKMPLFPDKA